VLAVLQTLPLIIGKHQGTANLNRTNAGNGIEAGSEATNQLYFLRIDMALEGYKVERCERKDISSFIETHHYSGSINGCIADYCFQLLDTKGALVGALFYGRMAMAGQYKRFTDTEQDVTELRRLCCIDDTPKNAESFLVGRTLRWLKKNTDLKLVVSYADAEYGHSGTIYKASNFEYLGLKAGARVIMLGDKKYHDKTIRTKYNGVLKPFAVKVKAALESGEAVYKKTAGKHTFVYRLRK
jgi:hypothetical protein